MEALAVLGADLPLWSLTRAAMSTGPGDLSLDPAQGHLWGLSRIPGLRGPDSGGGTIDLPAVLDTVTVAQLTRVLATPDGEDEFAVRPSGRHVRRLVRVPWPAAPQDVPPAEGTVLVTGASGAVGRHTALALARAGYGHFLLMTAGGGTSASGALRAELEALGAAVRLDTGDPSDRTALATALAGVDAEAPLSVVVHTGGGAALRNLHELTLDLPLTGFAAFADFAALTGSDPGSWHAAVDVAYAETLVRHRHARGLPATLLACGPLIPDAPAHAHAETKTEAAGEEEGEAETAAEVPSGMREFDPGRALACLPNVLAGSPGPVLGVADVDWAPYLAHATRLSTGALYRDLPEARGHLAEQRESGPDATATQAELRAELRELPEREQGERLAELVRSRVVQVLGHDDSEQFDASRSFLEIGLSSFTALELCNGLHRATGLPLPVAVVYDHPTPVALAGYLRRQLAAGTAA
ncbi:beta-ketoacyl reductase [Streptomyces sp. NPDC050263]|uniref:beta-ketoacyl reductase n=1 Tax=Streptomyces sp. NPDC050263 TaxID=3155037 RepID=UPI003447D1DF